MTKTAQMEIDLSQQELEYLKKLHVAQTLREWMLHPGWDIFMDISANMLARLEDQHLNFAVSGNNMASKDAYWASGIRLGGARDFAKVLREEIRKQVDILNQPLRAPKPPDPADMDGDNIEGE